MFHVRTTKTASKSTAVQIVQYKNRKLIVVKHLGSAHTDDEIQNLKKAAQQWIERQTKQLSLYSSPSTTSLFDQSQYQYIGFRYTLTYESFLKLCKTLKFDRLDNQLLLDLVIARIIKPGSKNHSIEFLKEFTGREHRREYLYRQLPKLLALKNSVLSKVTSFARKEFGFNFSLVFYDVTTLYFESCETDELRQCGFSKDNKFNQPQIVLGLLVTDNGFPLGYQIFEGKKFEGHTIVPILKGFKRKHRIKTFTVVADAAMISADNIKALRSAKLQYVVGARAANLSMHCIETISSQLHQQDGKTIRMETDLGNLVCEFSVKRYTKDKREMEKGIVKAESVLKHPGTMKRVKFISSENNTYTLNSSLIEKTKLLLGIKGYYTNLSKAEADDRLIIEHYHNLWHVEQAFRVTKSDLQIRPIYHFKHEAIEVHVLICFMALALCKYMEIKTGKSTKAILKLFNGVTDAIIVEKESGKKFTLRSIIRPEVENLLNKMALTR
jgi:transposase